MCPHDKIIYGSRTYQILYLPHDTFQEDNPCDIKKKKVDVVFTSFSGIDSSEMLFEAIKKKDEFKVFLGAPSFPIMTKQPWAVDGSLLPAFYEFTRRVYKSYLNRFDKYGDMFGGIYQSFEVFLGGASLDENAVKAYNVTKDLTHAILNRKYALSPYPSANKDFVQSTVDMHV